jgi:CubicO group peptidase (beta-lactamase class C family)
MASLAKQVTSALVLKEAEKGNINLQEKANAYLDPLQKTSNSVTIHHLLSHRSGVNEYGNTITSEPGSKFTYSNHGYRILGTILEKVTKKTFQALSIELFKQLGLNNSFFVDTPSVFASKIQHPMLTISHILYEGNLIDTSFDEQRLNANPAGGLISTAYDIDKWNHLLHEGGVLSKLMYEKMTSKISELEKDMWYGYGLYIIYTPENSTIPNEITHHGYAAGYKATLSYFPNSKISLVIAESISTHNISEDFKTHKEIRDIIRQKYAAKTTE